MMDVTFATTGGLTAGMAVAATLGSMFSQSHVLHGSLASQSLAADLPNEIFNAMEMAEDVQDMEGGANIGTKAMESIAVQTIAAAAPMMPKAIVNGARKGDLLRTHLITLITLQRSFSHNSRSVPCRSCPS